MSTLREEALALGAFRAELVRVEDISTDASFRSLCAVSYTHLDVYKRQVRQLCARFFSLVIIQVSLKRYRTRSLN